MTPTFLSQISEGGIIIGTALVVVITKPHVCILLIFVVFMIAVLFCPTSISPVKLFYLVAVYLVPSVMLEVDQWAVIE